MDKKLFSKNWSYYCTKYNLSLDNENYDDLEKAFLEVERDAIKNYKQLLWKKKKKNN